MCSLFIVIYDQAKMNRLSWIPFRKKSLDRQKQYCLISLYQLRTAMSNRIWSPKYTDQRLQNKYQTHRTKELIFFHFMKSCYAMSITLTNVDINMPRCFWIPLRGQFRESVLWFLIKGLVNGEIVAICRLYLVCIVPLSGKAFVTIRSDGETAMFWWRRLSHTSVYNYGTLLSVRANCKKWNVDLGDRFNFTFVINFFLTNLITVVLQSTLMDPSLVFNRWILKAASFVLCYAEL